MPLNPPRLGFALSLEAIAASTAYVLVDLSDTTSYKHGATGAIILYALEFSAEKATDGIFDVWVGVVKEADATNGSVEFFQCLHLESVHNPTDSTDRAIGRFDFGPHGLNLRVASDAAMYFVGNADQNDSTNWQTDTGLLSPVGAAGGATGRPGAGDLVMWVEEVGGAGTLDLFMRGEYETIA